MEELIKKYGLNVAKYSSSSTTVSLLNHVGSTNKNYSYITRKGIFLYLFLNQKLSKKHHEYIWNQYSNLWILESCIQEFCSIFERKSLPSLYLFIKKFKISPIKELVSFANGLEKDIEAIEQAVVSEWSNGLVEGTNNKLKMIKRTMYGRSSKKLLEVKLLYRTMNG